MKFEIICKQEKVSYVNKDKKQVEYVDTRYYLRNEELQRDIEILPFTHEFKDKDGTTRKITNREVLRSFAKVEKTNF